MRVGIIGGGVMGEAILGAALDRGFLEAANVTVADIAPQRREQLAHVYGVRGVADAAEAMDGAELVVLAVKPHEMHSVHGALSAECLLLSIMAGVTVKSLAEEFGHARIVRVMPNLPAAAKAGMSMWTATPEVDETQRDLARGLLAAIGRELFVDDESKLDMATAISGSGPGFVYLFMEAMVDAAVAIGLPRAQAEEMVLQTFYGAAVFAEATGRPAAELRGMVTSAAGTTAAGIVELEKAAVRGAIIESVRAAHRRAQELGGAG